MLQRAAIAGASANHPPLLIADEPTASLDAHLAVDVVQGLRERQQREGAAMLLITHQLGLAAQVADRVAVMYAGRVVELGPAGRCSSAPAIPTPGPSWRRCPARAAGSGAPGRGAALPGPGPSGLRVQPPLPAGAAGLPGGRGPAPDRGRGLPGGDGSARPAMRPR